MNRFRLAYIGCAGRLGGPCRLVRRGADLRLHHPLMQAGGQINRRKQGFGVLAGCLCMGILLGAVPRLYADAWTAPRISKVYTSIDPSTMMLSHTATIGLLYAWESVHPLESNNWIAFGAPMLATGKTMQTSSIITNPAGTFLFFRLRALAPALTCVATNTTVNGTTNVAARLLTWTDALGWKRTALMLDQTTTRAGVLRQYMYSGSNETRVCSAVPANGGAIQGMGYVVNHLGTGTPWGNWSATAGANANGKTTNVLAGPHHFILQYSLPNYTLNGKAIPTCVQWFFATGQAHPVFHIALDVRAHTAGNLGGDTRSPYGTMNFAGDGRSFPQPDDYKIGGVSWGDAYKFYTVQPNTTNESLTLRASSGWIYDESNSVPYAMGWMTAANAEQGIVATAPIAQQDQGSDPRTYPQTGFLKNQRDLNGPMVKSDDWAYQMMNYPDIPADGTYDTKIGWGANFGILGGFDNWGDTNVNLAEYSLHGNSAAPWTGTRTNGLFLAYSTFIVFGEHTGGARGGATGKAVQQVENLQAATLAAAIGSVKTQGPAAPGFTNSPVRVYASAGYNPIYAVWEATAADNRIDLTLTPAAGKPICNPIFRIFGYTAPAIPAISLDGQPGIPDSDCFVTLDTARSELWITVNRDVAAPLRIRVE